MPDGRVLAIPWYAPVGPLTAVTEAHGLREGSQRSTSTQPIVMGVSSDQEVLPHVFSLRQSIQELDGLDHLAAPQHPAEEVAYRALLGGETTQEMLREWIRCVPTSSLSVRNNRTAPETESSEVKSFISGAFVFGGVTGLHANTNQFPWSTRLPTSLVRAQIPQVCFSSVTASLNCHTRIHRDSNNHSFVPNCIIRGSFGLNMSKEKFL